MAKKQQISTLEEKFSYNIAQEAFNNIAKGRCQCCNKKLVYGNRGKQKEKGAWQAHHIEPVAINPNNDTLENCAILCINNDNCHQNCAHGGNFGSPLLLIQDWGKGHRERRCWRKNKDGSQCPQMIKIGTRRSYCHIHN